MTMFLFEPTNVQEKSPRFIIEAENEEDAKEIMTVNRTATNIITKSNTQSSNPAWLPPDIEQYYSSKELPEGSFNSQGDNIKLGQATFERLPVPKKIFRELI